MPALPNAPGAVKCRFEHTQEGRTWDFSLFYGDTHTSEYTSTDLTNLGNALAGAWGSATQGVARMSTEVTFVGIEVTDLFSNTAPRVDITDGTAGLSTTQALPMNVAMVIQRIQDRRYRGGKSHIYLAGYTTANLDTNQNFFKVADVGVVANDIVALDTAAHGVTSSHGDPFVPICVSYFDKALVPSPPHLRGSPVLFHITGTVGQHRVCSRRRRLPKL